jgi:hypothetical protein
LWLSVPEVLLYLVFKVLFRESKVKVPFQPVTCQHPTFYIDFKSLFCKAYRLSVNDFFKRRALNSCCTWIRAEKFDAPILTPTYSRKMSYSDLKLETAKARSAYRGILSRDRNCWGN